MSANTWIHGTFGGLCVLVAGVDPCQAQKIYWTGRGSHTLQRADLDGSNVETVLSLGGDQPIAAIAVDPYKGKMYWANDAPQPRKIQRADLDGSSVETLVVFESSTAFALALDVAAGKLYWTRYPVTAAGRVQRANLDGTNVEDLIPAGVYVIGQGMALDLEAGKMYFGATGVGQSILQRAALDGTDIEDLVTQVQSPEGVAFDAVHGRLYWTDFGTTLAGVKSSNPDGSSIQILVAGNRSRGIALDSSGGKMYWTDSTAGFLRRADLNGNNIENLVAFNGDTFMGVTLCLTRYADVFPPGGDGEINADDILYTLDGFADPASRRNADFFPCGTGDGEVDLDDILAVLNAFAGLPDCPDPCPSGPSRS